MGTMTRRAFVLVLAVAIAAPLLSAGADGAVVICQRNNKLKLRIDACTSWEAFVPASELGVTGPPGPPGMDGSAVAYAHVLYDGTVDEARSRNVTSANVSLEATSAFCFSGLTFPFENVIAVPDYGDSTTGGYVGLEATVAIDFPFGDCSGNPQAEVATSFGGLFAPISFFVIFN